MVWPGFASSLTFVDSLRLLNEVDFEPTRPGQVAFKLPQHLLDRNIPFGEISVRNDLDPTLLCTIRLSQAGGSGLACGLSRVTGDLVPDGMRFTSLKWAFAATGNVAHYEYLKEYVLEAVLQAIESGQLREHAFINGQSVMERMKSLLPAPVTPVSIAAPTQTRPQTAKPVVVSRKPLDLAGSMRPKTEPPRLIIREGRISPRRILPALKRCGVIIERGTHPKLKYGGRTTRFLNPSERNQFKNEMELYRVLDELHISLIDFYRAL